MIRGIKIATIIYCFGLFQTMLHAQNLKEDMFKVAEKYQAYSFKMNIEMKINHWKSDEPSKVEKGIVKKQGDNYFSDFGDQTTIKNKRYSLMLLKQEKYIQYIDLTQLAKNDSSGYQHDYLEILKADTTNYNRNAKLISADDKGKEYEVKVADGPIKKMRLKISNNYVLQQITYFYEKTEESPVKEVIITYNNVVFNPTFVSDEFSEKKYFRIVNGKAILTSTYKDYTILKGN